MTTFVFHANDAGRATVLNNAQQFLARLPVGKSWSIEVKPYSKARSCQQNRYVWGVCNAILSEALGFDPGDIHEYLCGTRWGWRQKSLPGGRTLEIPVRTTTTDETGKRNVLSRADFGAYVDFVQRFAAEKGIFIPDPEPELIRRGR